jgi:integrase
MAKQMGHSNTQMIFEHYYRVIPNLTRQDGSAFDKAAAQFGL